MVRALEQWHGMFIAGVHRATCRSVDFVSPNPTGKRRHTPPTPWTHHPTNLPLPQAAPVARQKRRSSNLDGMRTAIMPCFSMKCSAISPKAAWPTTTRAPVSGRVGGEGKQGVSCCGACMYMP